MDTGLKFIYDSTSFVQSGILEGGTPLGIVILFLIGVFVAGYIALEYLTIYRVIARERREKQNRKSTLKEMILMKEIQGGLDREIEERLQQTILTDAMQAEG